MDMLAFLADFYLWYVECKPEVFGRGLRNLPSIFGPLFTYIASIGPSVLSKGAFCLHELATAWNSRVKEIEASKHGGYLHPDWL